MTRERIYGTEAPFCQWMRGNRSMPSSEYVATDVDLLTHSYRTVVGQSKTKQLQCIQFIEVKTHSGNPSASQTDTLWKIHMTTKHHQVEVAGSSVRNYGISFVRVSGTRPDDSDSIQWGRFNRNQPVIRWHDIDLDKLESLMMCRHDPQTLEGRVARPHHKTQTVWQFKQCELGFTVAEPIIKRS